jgi:hypothetical protein
MIDESLSVWLIEMNTNPCIETSCPLLMRLIPSMLDNVFRITLDTLFPPPLKWAPQKHKSGLTVDSPFDSNKFELIFDEELEGKNYKSSNDQRNSLSLQYLIQYLEFISTQLKYNSM